MGMQPADKPRDYELFQATYAFFNETLFSGELPPCFIKLRRTRGSKSYFAPHRSDSGATRRWDELGLYLTPLPPTEILMTLVHQQLHCWQYHCGDNVPSRHFHNAEWVRKAKIIGLQPTATGQPGGKETGHQVTQYLIPGGRFDRAQEVILRKTGFQVEQLWMFSQSSKSPDHQASKAVWRFQCPGCRQCVWSESTGGFICQNCVRGLRAARDSQRVGDVIPFTCPRGCRLMRAPSTAQVLCGQCHAVMAAL
ncbi:SprT family zinc-dependent metalloprotease [Candidatus Entotheonella palauensis]|uniref:SprT family zinc-dependent metalloprotease n=1 Tax=Candidatus Entotheonella palauensis TaxID=93172 RepID=UPI0011784B40|nr:SprT family zinc-dependent metalloprotease [Candidatus Entotheonella palauensis]